MKNTKPFVRITCLLIAVLMALSVLSGVLFQLAYSF